MTSARRVMLYMPNAFIESMRRYRRRCLRTTCVWSCWRTHPIIRLPGATALWMPAATGGCPEGRYSGDPAQRVERRDRAFHALGNPPLRFDSCDVVPLQAGDFVLGLDGLGLVADLSADPAPRAVVAFLP